MDCIYLLPWRLLTSMPMWLNAEDAEPGVNASTNCSNRQAFGRQNATEKVSSPFRRIEETVEASSGNIPGHIDSITSWELRKFWSAFIVRLYLLWRRVRRKSGTCGSVPPKRKVPKHPFLGVGKILELVTAPHLHWPTTPGNIKPIYTEFLGP